MLITFSLRNEETHPVKIEEFMKENELSIKDERREEYIGAERSDFHYGSFIRSMLDEEG